MSTDAGDKRPSKRVRVSSEPDHVTRPLPHTAASDLERLKEIQVGIDAFVDDARPVFRGILKKRYTDFLVNEILPSGQTLHLRKTTVDKVAPSSRRPNSETSSAQNGVAQPEVATVTASAGASVPTRVEQTAPQTLAKPPQSHAQPAEVSDADKEKLIEYFNENAVADLLHLYEEIRNNPSKKSRDHPTVRTEFTSDRSVRAQIHEDIRRIFDHRIDSSTDKDGILVLSAAAPNTRSGTGPKQSGENQVRRGKLGWIDRGGEYVHFSLLKENKDTMEVISFLSKQLRTTAKTFQFAGTKDRRAVTTQRVSAYRLEAERLAALNRNLRNSAIGDFEYHENGLQLGELTGNEFVITLRECSLDSDVEGNSSDMANRIRELTAATLRDMHERGFHNYFGLQRFGTFANRTDTIGLHLLKGDFEGACDAILEYSPKALAKNTSDDPAEMVGTDDRSRAEAIEFWRSQKRINEALDKLPRKFSAEAALIRHLGKNPQDFLGALMNIQRNLRLMYVHAYQSLVWNLAAGERWRLFGDRVVEGDLVLVNEHKDKENHVEVLENVDVDGEVVIQAAEDDRAKSADDIFERARALTAEEASSGNYSIFDLVLPLPGYDILYPTNPSGEFYRTFMASECGGGIDPFDMRRKQRDFSLSGSYRKIIARIGPEYSVEAHRYHKEDQQFVQTDLDKLSLSRGGAGMRADALAAAANGDAQQEEAVAGEKIAVVLKFQLGSSQYATIALRELSKGGVQQHKGDYGGGR